MAQILNIDTGIKEYEINGNGLLRFNPSDPNVYSRFPELGKKMECVTRQYEEERKKAKTAEEQLAAIAKYDKEAKAELSAVFGPENDFDVLLGGVSLLATGRNGQYILTNVLEALKPLLEEGARNFMENAKKNAVAEAKARREALHELDSSALS